RDAFRQRGLYGRDLRVDPEVALAVAERADHAPGRVVNARHLLAQEPCCADALDIAAGVLGRKWSVLGFATPDHASSRTSGVTTPWRASRSIVSTGSPGQRCSRQYYLPPGEIRRVGRVPSIASRPCGSRRSRLSPRPTSRRGSSTGRARVVGGNHHLVA